MNTATSKNACIKTNLVVKCILECGFTQILQLYLGCHVWGCCYLVASDQISVLMTTLTQYIQHPRDCQLHAGRRWGCVRRLKGIQTYMLLSGSQSFSLQFLLLPLSSRSKERAQTLVCGRSFCFLIKLDGIVRGIDMVDNVRESLHYGYSPVQ